VPTPRGPDDPPGPPWPTQSRRVTIWTVLNGWILEVGCQQVVFVDMSVMLSELGRYLSSPAEVEAEYLSRAKG
jgi:hypothetical protein